MTIQTFEQKEVGLFQLERAVRLFRHEQDYFSALTLAGAAEGIFVRELKARGVEDPMDKFAEAVIQIHSFESADSAKPVIPLDSKWVFNRVNRARNALKHGPKTGRVIQIDVREEAADMIERAIGIYWRLDSTLSSEMVAFGREQRDLEPVHADHDLPKAE